MPEDQTPSKPENAEQLSDEGLSSSVLFSVVFHARPTCGPAEGAEIVVPVKTALELERRLLVIGADVAAIQDEWVETQPEGIRAVITNIRRHTNLSENVLPLAPADKPTTNNY